MRGVAATQSAQGMTEFRSPLLSTVLLLETRTVDSCHAAREAVRHALVRLTYSRFSWRLIRYMLQLCPKSTVIIIVGRFLEGIIPSINLRIKGAFLDIVNASSYTKIRFKPRLRKDHLIMLNYTNLVFFNFLCITLPLHSKTICYFLGKIL